jgi:hypothetical protein
MKEASIMIPMETRDPKKKALSEELAKQMADWEAKHGKIKTSPIVPPAKHKPFSINSGGQAKRNPERPTNLDLE